MKIQERITTLTEEIKDDNTTRLEHPLPWCVSKIRHQSGNCTKSRDGGKSKRRI